MIEGVKLRLSGRDFIVPALNFRQLKERKADIDKMSDPELAAKDGFGAERIDAIKRVLHAALSRNYPELEIEELDGLLDLNNSGRACDAVLGVSGLQRVESEEESPSGEAESPSTGTGSMQHSSPAESEAGNTSTSA